jgi:hypothetical protein
VWGMNFEGKGPQMGLNLLILLGGRCANLGKMLGILLRTNLFGFPEIPFGSAG